MIPEAAVEAAAKAIHEAGDWNCDYPWTGDDWRADCARTEARAALEAAAPHMVAGMEWAVFRASDGDEGTPVESWRYKSREAAQDSIDKGYNQPEFWEPRGRQVGAWAK